MEHGQTALVWVVFSAVHVNYDYDNVGDGQFVPAGGAYHYGVFGKDGRNDADAVKGL